jgi:glycosyltransferase involved in cell wall biosynthesis
MNIGSHIEVESLSIACIPAWNEQLTIAEIVRKTRAYVDKVFVIDDGSIDQTSLFAEKEGAIIIKHKKNMGYGEVLKTSFKIAQETRANVLVIIDGDGQHNPDEIPAIVRPILTNKADIAIGSRFIKGRTSNTPTIRKLGILILNLLTQLLGAQVLDSQSGFRAYSKKAFILIAPMESGMAAGSEILIKANKYGLRITEVPASCRYEIEQNFAHQFNHGLDVFFALIRMSLKDYFK